MKTKKHIRLLVFAALFTALIWVATALPQFRIPVPGSQGYVNLGDTFVILGAFVVGPVYGFLAAGIGSALADIYLASPVFAPGTFIIKGLMAVVVYFLAVSLARKMPKLRYLWQTLGALGAELVMILGYFLYEIPLYGVVVAAASIPWNIVQAVIGLVASAVLINLFTTNKTLVKKLDELR